ncbi:MAG: hypothetical protein J2P37_05635 [Ktedonobacteraceae bacterium]|nr:hypothetical protein [Ktedonobacteraceae bacterium]MBO0793865.1 hypothetical protein [Ktedonobacteraceae bacterium]
MNDQPFICPQCQSMDQAQKISAIYNAGTTITPHYSTTMAGSTPIPMVRHRVGHTYLSRMLRPPMPTRKFLWKATLPFLIILFVVEAAIVVAFNSDISIGGINSRLFFVPALVVVVVISLLFARKFRMKWQNSLTSEIQPKRQIWDRLFYCHRCDLVFDPDTQQSVPPARMGELLLAEAAPSSYGCSGRSASDDLTSM